MENTELEKAKALYGNLSEEEKIIVIDKIMPNAGVFRVIVQNIFTDAQYLEIARLHPNDSYVRPKAIAGIENNNGWIKIESVADLPTDDAIMYKIYHNQNYPKVNEIFSKNVVRQLYKENIITHFKPNQEDKPPIF